MADVFESLKTFENLQLLDLSDASSMQGPLLTPKAFPGDAGLCQMVSKQLMVLNIAEIGACAKTAVSHCTALAHLTSTTLAGLRQWPARAQPDALNTPNDGRTLLEPFVLVVARHRAA